MGERGGWRGAVGLAGCSGVWLSRPVWLRQPGEAALWVVWWQTLVQQGSQPWQHWRGAWLSENVVGPLWLEHWHQRPPRSLRYVGPCARHRPAGAHSPTPQLRRRQWGDRRSFRDSVAKRALSPSGAQARSSESRGEVGRVGGSLMDAQSGKGIVAVAGGQSLLWQDDPRLVDPRHPMSFWDSSANLLTHLHTHTHTHIHTHTHSLHNCVCSQLSGPTDTSTHTHTHTQTHTHIFSLT